MDGPVCGSMHFDRAFRNAERGTDLLVRFAFREELENLFLARGELRFIHGRPRRGRLMSRPVHRSWKNVYVARGSCLQRLFQFGRRTAFRDEAVAARRQYFEDRVSVTAICRDQEMN